MVSATIQWRLKIDKSRSFWSQAKNAAEQTPETRVRYVDLLRAISIGAVVLGHWLIAAPYSGGGGLTIQNTFHFAPWTVWLTWGFQVMPVFFIVGGYSNACSWASALRRGQPYSQWITARLTRLIFPVVILIVVWSALAVASRLGGVDTELITAGSIAALRPVWFLAVYVMIVAAVPISHRAWNHMGTAAFWFLAVCALGIDIAGIFGGYSAIRWVNFALVWFAVSQLGYFWLDGRLSQPPVALAWSAGGLIVLVLLVVYGGYPIAMVTVPGAEMSNSRPPTIAMIALAAFHIGLLLSVEAPVNRILQGIRLWAATILVNRFIMTIYLWHATAVVLMTGILALSGGFGLGLRPGSAEWWMSRPIWLLALCAVLLPLVLFFSKFEQLARSHKAQEIPGWQAIGGATLVCFGLARIALYGMNGDWHSIYWTVSVVLTLIGAGLISKPIRLLDRKT